MALHYGISEESREQLNRQFWKQYDTEHWFYKNKMHDALLENAEDFIEQMGDEEMQEKSAESFHQVIESEIVFNFYHITESLFMLILVSDNILPWLEMKHIRVGEITDFIREIVIDKEWEEGDIKRIFYPGLREPEEHEGTLDSSIEFIKEYLKRMSQRYLDNEIYNEYKHGMRLNTSNSSFRLAPEREFMRETGSAILEREGTAHTYLEAEELHREDSEVYHVLNRVTSGFDYELFQRLTYLNYLLIDQIVDIRQKQIQNEGDYKKGERIETHSFHDYNINDVFDYDADKQWEFKLSYPHDGTGITIS